MSPPISYDPNSENERPVPLPAAAVQPVNDYLSLQPPLSRRGRGPGILVLLPEPSTVLLSTSKSLDPDPVQKWAEEGFAVVFATGLGSRTTVKEVLDDAAQALSSKDREAIIDNRGRFGVIVYCDSHMAEALEAIEHNELFVCLIKYGHDVDTERVQTTSSPVLIHAGKDQPVNIVGSSAKVHHYSSASGFFVLPSSTEYDPGSAALSHSRSLVFLRKHLGGLNFDIEAIWEEHCYFEFEARSVAKTMATMVAEPYVNHIPTMTGGIGREKLTVFYRDHFIFSNPADARLEVISRTVGPDRVVDEFIYHITHDRFVDWLLPGVPPTKKKLAIPMMAVVNIRGDRLYNEHIWWDQATALSQCGLLPVYIPYKGSVEGSTDMILRLPVSGVEAAHMLVNESQGESNKMLGKEWGVVPAQTVKQEPNVM
ncbi:hypothetical protein FA15DRAFT_664186 [Coprinopsis marcescibilis]|uniref:SnoaL-like domain-containing protein n=1 Tax=Coprinopsis marcescibilis TaxID=230819 RepID=A0A5C3LB64_COPMA|nr:hypothetical protein FA15DRAFT_664186 [Coprinopsis marcescibilis]